LNKNSSEFLPEKPEPQKAIISPAKIDWPKSPLPSVLSALEKDLKKSVVLTNQSSSEKDKNINSSRDKDLSKERDTFKTKEKESKEK